MGNGASYSAWNYQFQELKRDHDEAYRIIDEAIKLEEQERPYDAVEKYKEGILKLDKALDTVITCPENPDNTWQQACSMVQKMKKTRGEVLTRINSITSAPGYVYPDPPPSYEEAMSGSDDSDLPRTYNDLAQALENLNIDTDILKEAELIYTHSGVKLYFISSDGVVLSSSDPSTLNILLVNGGDNVAPTAFLQVENWVYPLVPGVSPCYRTDYGAFILPDVHSETPGASIGIILPDDADAEVLELLESILHGVVSQTTRKAIGDLAPPITDDRQTVDPNENAISRGLITGANYISKGLIFGALKAGDLINYSTPKIINKITPNQQATPVPTRVASSFKFAGTASSKAAEVTGFVAEKLGTATSNLGHFLAPHIKKQGTRLLTSGFKFSEQEASNKINGILSVAAGAVEGFATVYNGLERSASILGHSLKDNSVKIVEHKYGPHAGEVATNALHTVGNVISIRQTAKYLTPKGIAKGAGKAIVMDCVSGVAAGTVATSQPSTSGQNMYKNLNQEKKEKDDEEELPLKK